MRACMVRWVDSQFGRLDERHRAPLIYSVKSVSGARARAAAAAGCNNKLERLP